ncbi:unnamed protein product [Rotaria socialis]|nr:unnamed protein product [Rotaria socialis]
MINENCQNIIKHLRDVVNQVHPCTTAEQCIQQLVDYEESISFVISSSTIGQHLVPDIHGMATLNTIFIFSGNEPQHQAWVQNWQKIEGVYTFIEHICKSWKWQ